MTTRTRTAESKGDAAPAEPTTEGPAEQPEPQSTEGADEAQQPSDGERALTEVEQMRREIRDSIGTVRANGDRHVELCKRLDALAETIAGLGSSESPAVDLDELHTRFDVLSSEIGGLTVPQCVAGASEAPVPDVLGKVLDVMRRVDEIGKGGKAPDKMGGYAFRKVDSAIDAVGAAVRAVGLVLRSEVVESHMFGRKVGSNPDAWGARVTMRYVFVSPVDGSEHAIEGVGEGADAGDKATSKACSMALKYALLQGLMIPVEGAHIDVEGEDTRSTPSAPQRGAQGQQHPSADVPGPDYGATAADRLAEQPPAPSGIRHGREAQRGSEAHAPARQQGASNDPPEVRAAEVLRRANDGRPAEALQALLGKAGEAGLTSVEVEWFGHKATLQQHMLAAIRLARGQQ